MLVCSDHRAAIMPRKAARAGEGGASASAREAAMRGWSAEERQAIYDAVVEFGENEWNLVSVRASAPRLASMAEALSLPSPVTCASSRRVLLRAPMPAPCVS